MTDIELKEIDGLKKTIARMGAIIDAITNIMDAANIPPIDSGGNIFTLPERIEYLIRLTEFARAGKSFKRDNEKKCSER